MASSWVYVLRCGDGTLYTGWTVDLERRLRRHSDGSGARYTRSRLPVELVWCAEQRDATAARREEARIKRLTRAQKLELIATDAAGNQRAATRRATEAA